MRQLGTSFKTLSIVEGILIDRSCMVPQKSPTSTCAGEALRHAIVLDDYLLLKHHLAIFNDQYGMLGNRDVFKRIALNRDYVGPLTGIEAA